MRDAVRRRLLVLGAGALVVLVATGATWAFTSGPGSDPLALLVVVALLGVTTRVVLDRTLE